MTLKFWQWSWPTCPRCHKKAKELPGSWMIDMAGGRCVCAECAPAAKKHSVDLCHSITSSTWRHLECGQYISNDISFEDHIRICTQMDRYKDVTISKR